LEYNGDSDKVIVVSASGHTSSNRGAQSESNNHEEADTFQQTRSSRPVAKLKTASGHHPTGGTLKADLSPHGSIRSAGTREYL